jgi:hypothetical protein
MHGCTRRAFMKGGALSLLGSAPVWAASRAFSCAPRTRRARARAPRC